MAISFSSTSLGRHLLEKRASLGLAPPVVAITFVSVVIPWCLLITAASMPYISIPPTESTPLRLESHIVHNREPWRSRLATALESRRAHVFILGLVLLDLALVLIEIIVSLFEKDEDLEHHVLFQVMSFLSLGILWLFVLEIILSVYAFGLHYLTSWAHLLDATIIIASLVAEMVLTGKEREVASLLIALRLWRVVRLIEGVATSVKMRYEQKQAELRRQVEMLEAELASEKRERAALEARLQMYAAV
ncbi:hypothetical protein THASP1DRAFT_29826 [Thamnocephalis sphaerospora]|uniref:Voltage-gated hydrogen channel 1 n=1 Tax=Thamnocephalis sphaerospora TaxID=78915 RepID=A0A4V1IWQ4_9FUNG|nr:hypothetical protein THASP1DRAFT_29826 [Thamnocephalis sphaerospora]|eukprot:RKP08369.1 hypothetical protein THASP1DRAFT_29826 [Thamnocephalis sphaerospora]